MGTCVRVLPGAIYYAFKCKRVCRVYSFCRTLVGRHTGLVGEYRRRYGQKESGPNRVDGRTYMAGNQ